MRPSLNLCWPTPSGWPAPGALAAAGGLAVLLIVSAPLAEVEPLRVLAAAGKMLSFAANFLVWPDLAYLPELGRKMLQTAEMAFVATAIAAALSLPLGVLAAANATPHPVLGQSLKALFSAVRALPELMWALMFVAAVGLGPLPGVMALAFVTVGFLAKFVAEAIEAVSDKPIEGLQAHGAGWLQRQAYATVPQAAPDLVGIHLYTLDHNLRSATILGLVGAGGIGYDLVMAMRLFQFDRVVLIALAIFLAVTALDQLSAALRKRVI